MVFKHFSGPFLILSGCFFHYYLVPPCSFSHHGGSYALFTIGNVTPLSPVSVLRKPLYGVFCTGFSRFIYGLVNFRYSLFCVG